MEVFCDGFDSANHFDSPASWSDSHVAAQQKLGLWAKRRDWASSDHRSHPASFESNLEEVSQRLGSSAFSLRLVA